MTSNRDGHAAALGENHLANEGHDVARRGRQQAILGRCADQRVKKTPRSALPIVDVPWCVRESGEFAQRA
jgi:hypothetical protein